MTDFHVRDGGTTYIVSASDEADARRQVHMHQARTAPIRPVVPQRNQTPLVPGGMPSFESSTMGSIRTNPLNGGRDPVSAAEQDRRVDWASSPQAHTNRARVATFAHGSTYGLQDELTGAGGGIIRALQQAGQPSLGEGDDMASRMGGGFQSGYGDMANLVRGEIGQYRAENPGEALGVELAGGIMSPANRVFGAAVNRLPFGAQLGRTAAGKGIPAWLAQTVQGVEGGVLGGGAYGFNTGEGSLDTRVQSAQTGMQVGGTIGALAPTAINTVARPLIGAAGHLWNALPTPAPNSVGAMGGNLRPRGGSGRPIISNDAMGTIDRMADNNRLSADDLQAALARSRENPQGEVLADIVDPTASRTRSIVQSPGQAGHMAADVARERAASSPERIMSALQRMLNVGESRSSAAQRLERDYEEASATLYKPVLSQPATPEMRAGLSREFGDVMMEDPIVVNARSRAQTIFDRDRRLGRVTGDFQANLPRFMHYLKMGLDAEITAERRNPTGLQSTEMNGVNELRARLVRAMDDNIPGYRQARERWGGIADAEDAMQEGADFLTMRPGEVRMRVRGDGTHLHPPMTAFELQHARIGLVDEIQNATAGNANRNVNVAARLSPRNVQRAVAELFDSPEQAADFMENTVNAQYRLVERANSWRGGSSTHVNQAHSEDEAAHALLDAGHTTMTHGPLAGAAQFGARAWNTVTLGAAERANNARATALFRRVDNGDSQAFADEVVRLIRQRQATRAATAAAARVSGAATASLPRQRQ